MVTYLGHLRALRDAATDPAEQLGLDALIAEAKAAAEFERTGHTDRIQGERATRQRYEVLGG